MTFASLRRLAALLAVTAAPLAVQAQNEPVLNITADPDDPRPTTTVFNVDKNGGIVSHGFVRDVGNTSGCAAYIPATGAGTRFMWHPCRGSLRFGRVPTNQTNWDDANMDDFTFAGGNQVTASGYGGFAYGDQVTVTSTVGVGFGSNVSVTGTAGFSAGASNLCSGFACTAIGYTVQATGQGSTALGYRTGAFGDYTTALGYRAVTCSVDPVNGVCNGTSYTGAIVIGDESTTTYVRSQAENEFRLRANGGIRMRVSTAANGNTPGAGGNVGCDLTTAVPTWTCASSRTLKHAYEDVEGEDVLARIATVPVTTWEMIGDSTRTRHMGPVAEDFHAGFGLGMGPTAIGLGDIDGVTFAGVKALAVRTDALAADAALAQAEVDALRADLAAATAAARASADRVAALEAETARLGAALSRADAALARLAAIEAALARLGALPVPDAAPATGTAPSNAPQK